MENQQPVNPLKAYFRKPGIWIKLPSNGQGYKEPPSDMNEMGEIPVYPLTAKDELMLKNADSLLNGTAIVDLMQSCAPSIKDPINMPSADLDAVIVAIKRSTYGEKLDVSTTCDCAEGTRNDISLDLNGMIANIKSMGDIPPVEHESGVKVYTKPVTVKHLLDLNWVQYEQIRNIQLADQRNASEKEKVDIMSASYEALTNQSLKVVADSIDTVLLPDGTVVKDSKMIEEWVKDLSRPEYKKLEESIMTTNQYGVQKEFDVQCQKCGNVYKSNLDLNPTTFFA